MFKKKSKIQEIVDIYGSMTEEEKLELEKALDTSEPKEVNEENTDIQVNEEKTQEETQIENQEENTKVEDETSTEVPEIKNESEIEENSNNQTEEFENEEIISKPSEDADLEMIKGGQPVDEESIPQIQTNEEPQSIVDDEGKELPTDFNQIIDGLTAKNQALEAENQVLRAKIDGAFGYSAKPAVPTKVNRLFDDCSDIKFSR